MFQHILVGLIFAVCLWYVTRRIVHYIKRARNNDPRCLTCTVPDCPLREKLGNHTQAPPDKGSVHCKKNDKAKKQDLSKLDKHKEIR